MTCSSESLSCASVVVFASSIIGSVIGLLTLLKLSSFCETNEIKLLKKRTDISLRALAVFWKGLIETGSSVVDSVFVSSGVTVASISSGRSFFWFSICCNSASCSSEIVVPYILSFKNKIYYYLIF